MSGDEDTPHKLPEARAPEEAPVSSEHERPGGRSTGIRHTGTPAPAASAPGAPNSTKDDVEDSAVGSEEQWIGRVIDERYRVVEKLGEGGMGAVFVAEHVKLQKPVALKVILPAFAGDGEMAARFAREAMASAKLDHPHVASALDYGTLPEGGAYLVMQLVRGRGLNSILEQHGAITWPAACNIAAQVADALAAAHTEGIVHRDLKPENILLEQRDESSELVKVLDFGIARVMAEEGGGDGDAAPRALTRLGTVMGTPGYMSPEQAVGERVDHRTDLYALGVILWEMVAGRPLFEGNDLTAIVTKQLTEMPAPLGQAAQDSSLPGTLEQLVASLLARKPEDRPDKTNEVRDALRQLAFSVTPPTGVAMPAHPSGSWAATPPTTGAGHPPQQAAAAPQGTAQTMLADATGPHSHPGIAAPPAPARGTTVGRGSRVPTRVDIAGRSVPVPAIVAGCAAPLVLGALVVVLVFALGGDDGGTAEGEGESDEGGLAGLLGPMKSPVEPRVPPEVQEHIETMLDSSSRRKRREAAQWLEDHEPQDEVPDFALAVADFELARGCRAMKNTLSKIRDADDDRALPALDRIADKPRRGCGFLGTRDCYGCLRRELDDTRSELRGEETDEEEGG